MYGAILGFMCWRTGETDKYKFRKRWVIDHERVKIKFDQAIDEFVQVTPQVQKSTG